MPKQKKTTKKDKNLAVIDRPQLSKAEAQSIRLPNAEEVSKDKYVFSMGYVAPSGELKIKKCTQKVWKEINSEELFKKFRYNFDIFTDENDVVQHINARAKAEFLPPGFDITDIKSELEDKEVKHLEIVKDATDTLRVMRSPSSCSRPTEDEILTGVQDLESISSGDYINGKYRVEEIREKSGATTYYIDSTFQE
jgi:hypothetical protein